MPSAPPNFIKNGPLAGWGAKLRHKGTQTHKYDHGHVVVWGGRQLTGAGCLAAISALRMGAGLCTVVTAQESANIYKAYSASLMVETCGEVARFKDHLQDQRRNTVVIGPGAGRDKPAGLKKAVLDAVQVIPRRVCVLDADALTVFSDDAKVLCHATGPHCVLTPHEGEFERIFPNLDGSKIERACTAAFKSQAIIVLKGHETIIASPGGECCVNTNGSGWLATAGTGDVLAGMIAGLAARTIEGLSLFESTCAAVWMHADAAARFGPGLISEDVPAQLPAVWAKLLKSKEK